MFKLREFRQDFGLSQMSVAELFNCKQSNISRIEKLGSNLEDYQWDILSARYGKEVLIQYLVSDEKIEQTRPLPQCTNPIQGVPYFEDIDATCSIISMSMDYSENPTFYINYEHLNDCSAYLPVVGDSMYPQYCAGEIVAVKRISNFDIILWGEAYLVCTNSNANDLRTIKLVHYCEDESKVILRAANPEYRGDLRIDKKDIISMFIVKGKIKRNQL